MGGLLSCGDMAELAERRSLVRPASVGGTVDLGSKAACKSRPTDVRLSTVVGGLLSHGDMAKLA